MIIMSVTGKNGKEHVVRVINIKMNALRELKNCVIYEVERCNLHLQNF